MDKKTLRTLVLYEFKLGHKAAETARNINKIWGPGTANDRTVQRWFEKFRSGYMSLEDRYRSGRPRKPEGTRRRRNRNNNKTIVINEQSDGDVEHLEIAVEVYETNDDDNGIDEDS